MKREKLLICVSAQHATAAFWRAGRIAQLEQFPHDDKGLADFREFLVPHPNVPVFLMASFAYLTALAIIHLLVPRLEPARV